MVSFAWGNLSNGRIPEDRMVSIGGGNYLRADAAAQFEVWAAAFNAVFGKQLIASEGYRSYAEQVRLKDYWTSQGQSYKAAAPGGSIHGWGLAVDIYSWVYLGTTASAEHKWMRENAPTYGFDWYTTGAPIDEPWHFDYVGGATVTAANTTLEEDMTPEQAGQLDYVYKALRGDPDLGYNNIDIIKSNVTPVHDALIRPNATTGPFRPIDVIVTHVKAILERVSK